MAVVQERGGEGLDQGSSYKDGEKGTVFRFILETESTGLANGLM